MPDKSPSFLRLELEHHLRFERLIADISSRFVNLPADQIDSEIEDAQRSICECLEIDGSALWQASPENPGSVLLSHIYRNSNIPPRPDRMAGDQSNPWMASQVLAGRIVAVADTTQTPLEASKDRETWSAYGIRSAIALPLSAGRGPVFGVLTFAAVGKRQNWPEELQQRLQLIAQIFANALERSRYEQQLKESEARLALAADCASAGFWVMDSNNGRIWATDKLFEMFGTTPDREMTFERMLSLVHPDDREAVRNAARSAIESGKESSVEFRVSRPDGSVCWMSSRGRTHVQSNREDAHLMGITIDITDAKRLEHERYELSTRLMRAGEEVRTRIARELHDDLGSSISVLGIKLDMLARSLPNATKIDGSPLLQLRSQVTQLGKKVSEVSHRLHSPELELLGLPAAIAAACRQTEEVSGISVKCRCDDMPKLKEGEIEGCFFRVLQEALNNAVKYSQAKRIDVVLTARHSRLQLEIVDDGVGFAWDDPARRRGLGLVGMSERMRLVGGTLKIDSQPGKGARIQASVPLPTQAG